MAGLQHPAEAGGMMTAPNPMATMVALWLKQVEAWSAAMRTAIVLSVRDITVYFPFGQGFTQDIDPRTNWGWMSGSATVWPEVEEHIVRRGASYGVQLDKINALLLDLAAHTPEADAEKVAEFKALTDKIDDVKKEYRRTRADV